MLNRGLTEAVAKGDAGRAGKYREALDSLPTAGLQVRETAGKIVLEAGVGFGIVPALSDEPKPITERQSGSLPQPGKDRTLAQTITHFRAVLSPNGEIDGDEDSVDYSEQFQRFEAESRRLGVLYDGLQPDAEGGREHDLIFDRDTGTVLKFTKPTSAGYEVDWSMGKPSLVPGLPLEYLERLKLHSEVFSDTIGFVGMGGDANNRRIITRQGLIKGRPPTWVEILRLMVDELGFEKLRNNFGIGYDDSFAFARGDVAVFDMRPANLFVTDSGVMVAIDSIPVRITDGQLAVLLGR